MKGKTSFKCFVLVSILSLKYIPVLSQTEECIENLRKAMDYFAEAQYENAIREYTEVIERSDYYDAYYGRGICYYMINKDTLALADFYNDETSSEHSKDTNFFWFRGQSHHRLKEHELAYKNYLQAEANDMSLKGQLGLSMGTVCYFLGLTEPAHSYLVYYLKYNEGVQGAWTNLGWIYLGMEKVDSAEYAFQKAYLLSKNGNDDSVSTAKCLNNLGYAQGLNGNIEKGLETINQSVVLNNANSFAYRNMAYLHMINGNNVGACDNLKIALELNFVEDWGSGYIKELLVYCE